MERKRVRCGWERKKKNRKKESVLLFYHTLLFFSFIPSVEVRLGVQRAEPGAEGSSALFGTPDRTLARGTGHREEAKAILAFFPPSLYCLPACWELPLITARAWFVAMPISKFLTKQIFREKY